MNDTQFRISRNPLPSSAAPSQSREPGSAADPPREHFIPIAKSDLVALLRARLAEVDGEAFDQLCRLLEATFHFQFHLRLEELKRLYAPFDPDRESPLADETSADDRKQLLAELFSRFVELLEQANFKQLQRAELEDALTATSDWGIHLHVDFDVFQRLVVMARGDVVDRRSRRRWHNMFRDEEVLVPLYQRLVVIFRLREHKRLEKLTDAEHVYIKVFKNIPKMDVDMLLPGSRVRMTLLDQGRILLPTLTGIGITVFKIVKGALILAFAGVYGVLAFVGLVGGTIGYGVKSFLGYLRTKDKYHLNLTRSLYYQNLDNNAGVLFRLLDEAEEQEFQEAIVAYFLLWREAGPPGWTGAELDVKAERLLRQMLHRDVDFEVNDALAKLERLQLIEKSSDNRWKAVPIRHALAALDRAWDSYFRHAEGGLD